MKYVICYMTDNNDLYSHECETREEVDAWLEENDEYKAIIIGVPSSTAVKIEDRT